MNKFYTMFTGLLLLTSLYLFGQPETLPRDLSPAEKQWMVEGNFIAAPPPVFGITEPPTQPIRAMAEWEELQALLIVWYSHKSLLAQIINAAKPACKVVVVCTNISVCQAELTANGVDWSQNIDFIVAPSQSLWVRDYGGVPCYLNDVDSLVWVDWIYNRARPLDDAMPEHFGAYFNMPVYTTTVAPNDLVCTGGNFMTDGMGFGFSSKLVLQDNDSTNMFGTSNHSEAEVEEIMNVFTSISPYAKMNTLPYDEIHHIDMHMKLLDEVTLLVGQYPPGVADGPQIEANLQYVLNNFTTSYGTPFKVIRIPMPPDQFNHYPGPSQYGQYRTYTNAVFVNKTIIVPVYEEQYDTTALRIWHDAMPGYNIIGVDCDEIIHLTGAVHCVTKEVGVRNPLLINHRRLDNITGANPPAYEVQASIRHKSGIAAASVFYKTDLAAPYQELTMSINNAAPDSWTASIPQQPIGTRVYYYIQATANSGKQIARPLPAPEAYFKFDVLGPTGVDDPLSVANRLGPVFPNPAAARTCVSVNSAHAGMATIALFDPLGRRVETIFSGYLPAGASDYFFGTEGLGDGVYFVKLDSGDGMDVEEVRVQH